MNQNVVKYFITFLSYNDLLLNYLNIAKSPLSIYGVR